MHDKIEAFAAYLEGQQRKGYEARHGTGYPDLRDAASRTTIKPGKRWTKVDVGTSGKYMVDTDGAIYGIKGYGVPHFGHQYGTLDTIHEWDWSGYTAVRVAA